MASSKLLWPSHYKSIIPLIMFSCPTCNVVSHLVLDSHLQQFRCYLNVVHFKTPSCHRRLKWHGVKSDELTAGCCHSYSADRTRLFSTTKGVLVLVTLNLFLAPTAIYSFQVCFYEINSICCKNVLVSMCSICSWHHIFEKEHPSALPKATYS